MIRDSDAPFNMAMLYYQSFHELRGIKRQAMLQNNLPLAYECIEEMYTEVSFKLNKDEKKEIETLKTELKAILPQHGVNLPTILTLDVNQKFQEKLRIIDRRLLKLMDKYKMIFPNIEVRGGLEKLHSKYGLQNNTEAKNNVKQ